MTLKKKKRMKKNLKSSVSELGGGWAYAFGSSLFPKCLAHTKLLNIWRSEYANKKNVQKVDSRTNEM